MMKLRVRLSLYFTMTSSIALLLVLGAVYFSFLKILEADFFERLTDRTMVTAKLYLEADEISRDSLNKVRDTYLRKMDSEVIRIYNAKNSAEFIGDDQQYWNAKTIDLVRIKKKVQLAEGQRKVVGIFYKDNQGDFVILASAIDHSNNRRMMLLLRIMVISYIIIFMVLLIFGQWIANRFLAPLETFVANASHELRTPITRMFIAAELALSKSRSPEVYRETLESVLEDADKMDKIITVLLDLAQTDLKQGQPNLSPVRIDELLWQLQDEWKSGSPAQELRIEIPILPEDEEEMSILANATQLHIALNNIIANAFKFSDGKTVRCLLSFKEREIVLSITDEGVGITNAHLQQIFEPFNSLAVNPTHKGSGMGLYMANKIVRLFKGSISVNTVVGKGSTFTISFPKV